MKVESEPSEGVDSGHPCSGIVSRLLQTDEYNDIVRSPSVAALDSDDLDRVRKIPAFLRKAVKTGNLDKNN